MYKYLTDLWCETVHIENLQIILKNYIYQYLSPNVYKHWGLFIPDF